MRDKPELVRVFADGDELKIDETHKMSGRGTYICKNSECILAAQKKKAAIKNSPPNTSAARFNIRRNAAYHSLFEIIFIPPLPRVADRCPHFLDRNTQRPHQPQRLRKVRRWTLEQIVERRP